MALRVLLADESSTIKKAIQMVLSDYGVDVKTVPTGIDVFTVAQSFSPDIVLADVLLNKKNGYEVCLELKSNEETNNIPVVLMWSSFMQLDQAQYRLCKADGSIEKPFDTETIRSLVESLVPKLQTFPLKGFLNHAKLPDFEESDTFVKQRTDYNTLAKKPPLAKEPTAITAIIEPGDLTLPKEITQTTRQTMTAFVIDESTNSLKKTNPLSDTQTPASKKILQQPAPVQEKPQHAQLPPQEPDEWSNAKAGQFVIETENFGDFEEVKVINHGRGAEEETPDLQKKINEQIQSYLKDSPVASHKAQTTLQQKTVHSAFDEQLIREEIRQTAERICWQIIAEVTEKIVREELGKLLQGIEKST